MIFSLRPATLDDIHSMIEIEKKVHPAPWIDQHFIAELEKPYSRVLLSTDDETDTLISGYIVYWLINDVCEILNLAVDLPYRGLGIGKQLVRAGIKDAVKTDILKLRLEVRKSNQAAVQLYQSLGFSITQIRKSFYSDGEDAYHMSLNCDPVKTLDNL